ncbi:hypothetical protein TNCV_2825971 [Trichonephila clavipes]|nr:hypothetical protein TNCV_2825971 [Trichonephila clavipes]
MDKVPLSFDIPPTRTVDVQGASSIPINTTGNERTSFTVVLCCAANGQFLEERKKAKVYICKQYEIINKTLALLCEQRELLLEDKTDNNDAMLFKWVSHQTDHLTGTSANAPQCLWSGVLSWAQYALPIMSCFATESS